jgi:penicillin-binding protein 1C
MAVRGDSSKPLSPGPGLLCRALLLVGVPAFFTAAALSLPWPQLDEFLADPSGARIVDRSGALLGFVPSRIGAFQLQEGPGDIPTACAALFVQLEDARFYDHPGVDPVAVLRAIAARVPGVGSESGASTITMQVARLAAPHSRGIGGKVLEMVNALRVETRLTKRQILTVYLNGLPFGRNTRGVGAAAWTYFGRELSGLTRAELLVMAVIPRNPTLFDPFDHGPRLIEAARTINERKGLGVDPAQIEAAVLGVRSGRPAGAAPHFARYVTGEVQSGRIRPVDGTVRTSLDSGLTSAIQSRVGFILSRYAEARVTNASVVVIDNATGAVIGWVGSRSFTDTAHSGQIDGVLIRRQSASTLKPFLYGMAIQRGWTAATLLPDVPLVFGTSDEEAYRPENFDKRSHGVVRLRTALASSLNVPAVFTLSRIGLPDFLGKLRDLGFTLPDDAVTRYGLGTAIGNAEVSLLELAHAFSVFPRGGTIADLTLQAGVTGKDRRIFDPFSAWLICNILSDHSARVTGFGTRTYFRTVFPAMFKSGTSSEFTNLWCVGATPQYTVAAWAGNFDGRAVINKTGSIVPTQIVAEALNMLGDQRPVQAAQRSFREPTGVVQARICTDTGLGATPACTSTRVEYFRSAAQVPAADTDHGRPDAEARLLRESFLGPGESVRVLFPVSGQTIYLDETLRAGLQRIPVVVVTRSEAAARMSLDGVALAARPPGSPVTIPLERGIHTVVARSGADADRAVFEVR